ncbi:MAG: Fe-S cluster assembly protein SufD [Lysobacterales bacterium]
MSDTLAERLLAALPESAEPAAVEARRHFLAAGLPTPKVESWRYSSLRGLQALDPAAGHAPAVVPPELAGLSGTLATLTAGGWTLSPDAPAGLSLSVGATSRRDQAPVGATSRRDQAPVGATSRRDQAPAGATSRRDLLAEGNENGKCDDGGRDARSLLPTANTAADAFRLLNQAGATECLTLDVAGTVNGIWRLALQHDALGLSQSRLQLNLCENASITLMEHWFGADEAGGLSNVLLDVDLQAGAQLTLIRLQETGAKAQSVQQTRIRCAAGAQVSLVVLELGGLWSRHDLQLQLAAAGAIVNVHGLVALQGRQHHDSQLALTHAAGAAQSKTLWKAIANARSRSVFDGLITVAPGADQTEAHLKTANLLLSAHAEIDTKPELVIEADEVVCSHGATVGQLDDKVLFYLRSRGIPMALARQMLTLAFGGEVLSAVADETLRAALAERVAVHLPQGAVD